MQLQIPYDRDVLTAEVADDRVVAQLRPRAMESKGQAGIKIVREALKNPIESAGLAALAKGKKRVLIIASDHTRPVPSQDIIPPMLEEIRRGSEEAEIHILVATGCHRPSTEDEMQEKFGEDVLSACQLVMHISTRDEDMVHKGRLPSGGELFLHKEVDWADLIVAEGFIEPHFFAGFSGGRKSVLPGIASDRTVLYNHNAVFIDDVHSRTGILAGNPMHEDMLYAAKKAGLAFITNVVLNEEKKTAAAFCGDPFAAHKAGCDFLARHATVQAPPADIVVTSNGGYPLDQNLYQAVKGMTAAEACVKAGGVIIMCAACSDGIGGDDFFRWMAEEESAADVMARILQIPKEETTADQWQAQILARVLLHARVIMVTAPRLEPVVQAMHMDYAKNLDEALAMAGQGELLVIPDGVGVIVQAQKTSTTG